MWPIWLIAHDSVLYSEISTKFRTDQHGLDPTMRIVYRTAHVSALKAVQSVVCWVTPSRPSIVGSGSIILGRVFQRRVHGTPTFHTRQMVFLYQEIILYAWKHIQGFAGIKNGAESVVALSQCFKRLNSAWIRAFTSSIQAEKETRLTLEGRIQVKEAHSFQKYLLPKQDSRGPSKRLFHPE